MTTPEPNDTRSDNSGVERPAAQPSVADGGLVDRLVDLATPDQQTISLSEDELYEVLSARRRRMVIRLLAGTYDPETETYVEVNELARAFAHTNCERPDAQDRKRYYISLVQTHLPLLDEVGLIEYHERPKKIEASAEVVVVADVMSTIADLCEGSAWYRSTPPEGRAE